MEEKLYPLSTSQHLLMLSQETSGNSVAANLCTLMHFLVPVDPELLLQAATLASLRNKTASTRLTRRDGELWQYFTQQPPLPILVRRYEPGQEALMARELDGWRREPFSKDCLDVQLFAICLLQKPDGLWSIFFRLSNMAFDTYSLMSMAADTLRIYGSLRDGRPLPTLRMEPLRNCLAEKEYGKSPQREKDILFWREVFRDEPLYSSLNPEEDRRGRWQLLSRQNSAGELTMTVGAALVDKINACAREMQVSPQVLYLLAMRNCLSEACHGQEDITLTSTLARRATLEQKRAGGSMVQAVLFRMNFSNELSFQQACQELHHLQYQYYAHAALPMDELMRHCLPHLPVGGVYGSVGVSFQPFFLPGEGLLPVRLEKLSSGVSTMPLMLNIFAADTSGSLTFHYDYQLAALNRQILQECHQKILAFLHAALENPQLTLKELMKNP